MKKMKIRSAIIVCFLAGTVTMSVAQIKIGNNQNTINGNSILEMEDSAKGMLPPRVKINNINNVSPLTAPVPEGMLVYSDGGAVKDGVYFWNGSKWESTGANYFNIVAKTSNATLTKGETFVITSNDVTITLPAVNSADDGLAITVKNNGSYMDLLTVSGNNGATLDGIPAIYLTRYRSLTFIAYNGNWLIKNLENKTPCLLEVSPIGSFKNIAQVVEFLGEHMMMPAIVRFCGGNYPVTETQVIDLPYPVTFEGLSYGETSILTASGLAGKPMFRCKSDCNFKMLVFDATALAGYGDNPGEDAIRFVGNNTYNEVKDCYFLHFHKGIVDSANAEIWMFESDFEDAVYAGIEFTGAEDSLVFKMSEVDFTNCARGIVFDKGAYVTTSIQNCGFYNSLSVDTAVVYRPATFSFTSMFFTGNMWNNIGTYVCGLDFSRNDGRDANISIKNNLGIEDNDAHCSFNVTNNTSTTTISSAGTWYKANWTNTSSNTCNLEVTNNKIKYIPVHEADAWCIITGNLSYNNPNKVVSISIVKNGDPNIRYGETQLRIVTANQPFQFSTVIYVKDLKENDFIELYCTSNGSGDIVTFRDVQWFTETK